MLICYSEQWISFFLLCLWSPRQSSSFCSVNSWFRFSAGSGRRGDQVQLGLLSKERVHSKAPLQMGSPYYTPGDPHRAGVQQSPASFPNSLLYLPVSPGLAAGMETLPWPLLATGDHFCVSLGWAAAGSPLCPGGLCALKHQPRSLPLGWCPLHNFTPPPWLRNLRGCCLYSLFNFPLIVVASACGCLLISWIHT